VKQSHKVSVFKEKILAMMYLLFAGKYHYPKGGIGDLIGAFETLDEAKEKAKGYEKLYIDGKSVEWYQIYDVALGKVVDARPLLDCAENPIYDDVEKRRVKAEREAMNSMEDYNEYITPQREKPRNDLPHMKIRAFRRLDNTKDKA